MNKYLIKPGIRGMFSINENNELDVQDYLRTTIDWCYRVPEDGVLSLKLDEKLKELGIEQKDIEVKKDDIVMVFYPKQGLKNILAVVHNEDWIEIIDTKDPAESISKQEVTQG